MRPKKVILCVDADEQALSCRVFLLQTWGFEVKRAMGFEGAMEILRACEPNVIDVLIVESPMVMGEEFMPAVQKMHPLMRTIITSRASADYDPASRADAYMPKDACSPADLVQRVRILSQRKRGPHKATQSALYQRREAMAAMRVSA